MCASGSVNNFGSKKEINFENHFYSNTDTDAHCTKHPKVMKRFINLENYEKMISKQSIENQYGGSRFYNLILLGKLALVCNEKQNKIINARSRVESAAAARTEH